MRLKLVVIIIGALFYSQSSPHPEAPVLLSITTSDSVPYLPVHTSGSVVCTHDGQQRQRRTAEVTQR
jgi:hypothetical protein